MATQLIQILLPLYDNKGVVLPRFNFDAVKKELTDEFKGLTVYSRSVAEGFWKGKDGENKDAIVVYEVMTKSLKKAWWKKYRTKLEKRFGQREIIVRAQKVRTL